MDEHRRAVLGFLGTVLSVGAALVIASVRPPLLRGGWLVVIWVAVGVVFMIGVALALPDVRGMLRPGRGASPRPRGRVVLTEPRPDRPVKQATTARGTARGIPGDVALWLVIEVGDHFYPQQRITPLPDGRWECPVWFGAVGKDDVGELFTLHAVGADADASSRFEIFGQLAAAQQSLAPLSRAAGSYPPVEQYASVRVRRGL